MELIQTQPLLKDLILPIILALLAGGGFWTWFRYKTSGRDRANARLTYARRESILAEVEDKRANTQINLYTNAMKLVDSLERQLQDSIQREERLQSRLVEVELELEAEQERIRQIMEQLQKEKELRTRLEMELERVKRDLEDRTSPGRRNSPP